MADSKKIDYIDTQGLGPKLTPEEVEELKKNPQKHKPMMVQPRRIYTPELVKEFKILINEVLDEREGKMDYISYFDTEKFKYPVGGQEPPYKQ